MTACVNKHTKRVAAVVTASLVGALSLGVAVPAFAAEGDIDLQATIGTEWEGVTLEWSGTYDEVNGCWTVPAGEQFTLKGATAADGTTAIPLSDLTVVYTDNGGNVYKTAPAADSYKVWVIDGAYKWHKVDTAAELHALDAAGKTKTVEVKVVKKSVEGAVAIEGDDANDTSFKYTGSSKKLGFAVDGKVLTEGTDYVLQSLVTAGGPTADATNAGDYVATITGINDYAGSAATVDFTVDPVDFDNDTFTIDTQVVGIQFNGKADLGTSASVIKVNGEPLVDPTIITGIAAAWNENGAAYANPGDYKGDVPAKVDLRIATSAAGSKNFKGEAAHAKFDVVSKLISNFYYDNKPLKLDANRVATLVIDSSKGESFDPAKITAAEKDGGKNLARTVTVARDGEETEDYSTPGTLTASVEVTAPKNLAYGGSATIEVKIVGKHYAYDPTAYISIDGKDISAGVEYDGEAVVPSIVVKSGSTVLDAADYTVTYKDAEGNAVEGDIVEPGTYTGTIDFGNASYGINGDNKPVTNIEFTFEVTKATIHSAKADQDFYAVTGEAVTPKFTAYTGEDLDGLSVEIDPATVGVSYYKAVERTWTGNPFDPSDDVKYWDITGDPIKASDLKKAGNYIAVVNVPADDPHFQGSTKSQMFEIGEYAVFSDVAADAWYAESVYNANDLGYMTGIKGTDLFMPLADISRAELSQVFFNMAGNSSDTEKYYPTAFGDVDGWAWYAQPVAWASEAGIVTGYDADTFGPMDKATREQVAVMLYRYAKAQGKDVSVSDVDGALAAYKDGDQVSDWAREAMAWAVENDIFGQNTDELWAKQNIQRAAVATIAVRFQPEALPQA